MIELGFFEGFLTGLKRGGGFIGLCFFFFNLCLFHGDLLGLHLIFSDHNYAEDAEDADGGDQKVNYSLQPGSPKDGYFGGEYFAGLVDYGLDNNGFDGIQAAGFNEEGNEGIKVDEGDGFLKNFKKFI